MKKETHQEAASSGNPWMFVSLFLGALLVASFVTNIYVISTVSDLRSGAAAPTPSAAAPSGGQAAPSGPIVVSGTGPTIGDAKAKVTIVEFSDFQCPFCKRFHDETYGQIKTNYIDTGKVKLVFRNYPLPFHQNAEVAAEAAMCANDQGKFWEMHETLFTKGSGDGTGLDAVSLKQYAADLGLDTTRFNSCLDSRKYSSLIQKDTADGSAAGVSGTPSFIINGKLVVGAQPYSAFAAAIDAALAQ